jgi:hypothetical protein
MVDETAIRLLARQESFGKEMVALGGCAPALGARCVRQRAGRSDSVQTPAR